MVSFGAWDTKKIGVTSNAKLFTMQKINDGMA
jgi:hypothetical protein